MDLPERMLTNKVSSRLGSSALSIGLSRISFLPYNHNQLTQILESRLEGIMEIEGQALELCARKISAVSGDARRALDLCRYHHILR
jgi:origin recognition complex subunit 1